MPSITPLTNLNSGFRMYEVDSAISSLLFLFRVFVLKFRHRHLTSWMHTRTCGRVALVKEMYLLLVTMQLDQSRRRVPGAR